MKKYLYDARHRLVGEIEESWDNKSTLYDKKLHCQLGYYDANKDETYDSYGELVGEGNLLADLAYYPHPLRFPLPELSQVSFTSYRLERAGIDSRTRYSTSNYWDDGTCKICEKRQKQTCHVQGLPGMCETCYRFFHMYSRTDAFELERKSKRYPITIEQIRQAVNKEKAPFLAVDKALSNTPLMLYTALKAMEKSGENRNREVTSEPSRPVVQRQTSNSTVSAVKPRKKKSGWRWYHWVFIILAIYVLIKVIVPLTLTYVM